MSHSPKITDIEPRASEEEVKDMVQASEFETSNSDESAPAEDISLRGTSNDGEAGEPGDAGNAVPDTLEENSEGEATEEGGKVEGEEVSDADAETAEIGVAVEDVAYVVRRLRHDGRARNRAAFGPWDFALVRLGPPERRRG